MIILPPHKHVFLCNKLILFAHFIAYHLETGRSIAYPDFARFSNLFPFFNGDVYNRIPHKKSTLPATKNFRFFTAELNYWAAKVFNKMNLNNSMIATLDIGWDKEIDFESTDFKEGVRKGGSFFLQGWLYRDHELVMKHRTAILEYFKPEANLLNNIEDKFAEIKKSKDTVIGVHIRQGDYKNWQDGKYYYEQDTYASKMKALQDDMKGKTLQFVVCSDGNINLNAFDGLDVILGPGSMIEDLYTLVACDYLIGPPSTFSYWASWYGNTPYLELETADVPVSLDQFKVKVI